jgi:hypothetical protein
MHKLDITVWDLLRVPRSVQLHGSHREDLFPEVRLAVIAQGAAYCGNGLDRQWHESGI